jgi:hypothetical protein
VQYILKYVAPLYLIAIFVTFCYFKLPSRETEQFSLQRAAAVAIPTGEIPADLRAEFARRNLELPPDATIERTGKGVWKIFFESVKPPEYALRETAGAEGRSTLAISERKPGTIEQLWYSPVAILSVTFLALILAFLMFSTYLAGCKWEREGQLTAARRERTN